MIAYIMLTSFPQIQDLVSNTNYTLHISGVTGKGVGAPTTVFIYIRATLESEPHITTECKSARVEFAVVTYFTHTHICFVYLYVCVCVQCQTNASYNGLIFPHVIY